MSRDAPAVDEEAFRADQDAGVMTGYHTRWVRPEGLAEDPERIAIKEALA